ncbi:MAG: hypothetical protein QXF01_00845 [Candidatus Micrarchaeaceae archaeon]
MGHPTTGKMPRASEAYTAKNAAMPNQCAFDFSRLARDVLSMFLRCLMNNYTSIDEQRVKRKLNMTQYLKTLHLY